MSKNHALQINGPHTNMLKPHVTFQLIWRWNLATTTHYTTILHTTALHTISCAIFGIFRVCIVLWNSIRWNYLIKMPNELRYLFLVDTNERLNRQKIGLAVVWSNNYHYFINKLNSLDQMIIYFMYKIFTALQLRNTMHVLSKISQRIYQSLINNTWAILTLGDFKSCWNVTYWTQLKLTKFISGYMTYITTTHDNHFTQQFNIYIYIYNIILLSWVS